jgi:hypothetical protein
MTVLWVLRIDPDQSWKRAIFWNYKIGFTGGGRTGRGAMPAMSYSQRSHCQDEIMRGMMGRFNVDRAFGGLTWR